MLSDYRLFFREYVRHFHDTGSISPSSRWLAAALARFVGSGGSGSGGSGSGAGKRIVEIGPGTGAVTRRIVGRMNPNDTLDLVELNGSFVERLRKLLVSDPSFAPKADRIRVLHQKAEDLPSVEKYDVIISGLPLNNFTVEVVEQILETLKSLAAPGGTISFFEYIAIRAVRSVISSREEKARLKGIGQALQKLLRPHEIRCEWIWPNVPPAWVHHVRL